MKPGKLPSAISSGINAIIKPLTWLVYVVLGMMVLLVVGNVVGRFLFQNPLMGTIELVEFMMVIVAFFAIAFTAMERGHVRVSLVISRLSRRTQAVLGSIAFFLSAAIFAAITYQAVVNAIYYAQHLREASTVLFISFAPFRFVMFLGCLLLCLRLLLDVFHPLPPEEGPKGGSAK